MDATYFFLITWATCFAFPTSHPSTCIERGRPVDLTRPQTDRVKFSNKDKVEIRCISQYIFSDGLEPNTNKQKSTFSS